MNAISWIQNSNQKKIIAAFLSAFLAFPLSSLSAVNQPPIVSAGPDLTTTPLTPTDINGSVTDDGLPAEVPLSILWEVVSAPGVVGMSNDRTAQTQVSFSKGGVYVLRLIATDSEFIASDDVTIIVDDSGVSNQPPRVEAGAPQTITLPSGASMQGYVISDGLPVGVVTTIFWSKVSGPGSVSFTNPGSPRSTAIFSESGTYLLKLTADDTEFSVSDNVTITVFPQGPPNTPPLVSAGNDQTITLPDTAIVTGIVSDDGNPSPNTMQYEWIMILGPEIVTFGNNSALSTLVTFPKSGDYVLRLIARDGELSQFDDVSIRVNDAPVVNQPPTVFAGETHFVVLPQPARLRAVVKDDGLPSGQSLTYKWTYQGGVTEPTIVTPNDINTDIQFSDPGPYGFLLTVSDSEHTVSDEVFIIVDADGTPNTRPVVNAGEDFTVDYQEEIKLYAWVGDDGLPATANLSYQWSLVDGPGIVTWTNKQGLETNVNYSRSGTYVFRFSASDSILSSEDEITVTVRPSPYNNIPLVDAGEDQTITLPSLAYLTGWAGDDGNPTSTLHKIWTVSSGPGHVYFTAVDHPQSAAIFSAPGTYELILTANDYWDENSDSVIITVQPATETNQPPVISAGSDQIITLPNSVNLTGSASDDGLPTGSNVTVTWSKVSGPGTVNFSKTNTLSTTAGFSTQGDYVLRLTATDSELSSIDDVSIKVNPIPTVNQAPVVSAGEDQIVNLNDVVTLSAVVSDDGLPASGGLAMVWFKIDGPGTVQFQNSAAANTTVQFSQPGIYELQLYVSDSVLDSSDNIVITVDDVKIPPATLVFTSPSEGEILQNTATIEVTTENIDDSKGVQFFIDGIEEGAPILYKPYRFNLNTALFLNGSHQLSARAYSTEGESIFARRSFLVQNQIPSGQSSSFKNVFFPLKGEKLQIPVPESGFVSVDAYSKSGEKVEELWIGEAPSTGVVEWDGRRGSQVVGAGVYLLIIKTANRSEVKKIIVLK